MSGRSSNRLGTMVLQVQNGLHGKLGREDGGRRGHAFCGIEDLTLTGIHRHVVAALLAEMKDVRGSACFENCETEFRHSEMYSASRVGAPVLWGRVAKYVSLKAEEKWKTNSWGRAFGRGFDDECSLGGVMWADN